MKKAFFVLAALLILSNLYVRYSAKHAPPSAAVTIAEPHAQAISQIKKPAPFKVGDNVRTWGMDKGELLVPEINLWIKPGLLTANQKVVGRLSHNTRVKITGRERMPGKWFFLIETPGHGSRGWISETLLKK